MLKISLSPNTSPARTVIRLEGQVAGQWVVELRRVYDDQRQAARSITLDLADVTFIDPAGLAFFGEVVADVALVNCSIFAAEQLKPVFERHHACERT